MAPSRIIAVVLALLAAPVVANAQRETLPPDDYDFVQNRWPDAKVTSTGIRYVVENAGTGPVLQGGDQVDVLYIGSLLHGKVFDKMQDKKHPFTFRVNRNFVIDGWDQILQLMRPGDKWIVIIPPELAYGRRGSPPKIPSNSTLVFELEILAARKD